MSSSITFIDSVYFILIIIKKKIIEKIRRNPVKDNRKFDKSFKNGNEKR